ncbi:MAG: hypothetical protein Q9174_001805 [Haloplaca sp. 1 TL-2023]
MGQITTDRSSNSYHLPPVKAAVSRSLAYTQDDVLRLTSGNERVLVAGRRTELTEVKTEDDDYCVASPRPRRSSHRAQVAIKLQQKKKKKGATKDDDWLGYLPAELYSPKYIRYREKLREKTKHNNGQEVPWPDRLERAFQLALRAVPPVGRKKKYIDGRLRGRNEEISEVLKKWTGYDRNRKQISSHIQVLKGFMSDNSEWMQHVTPQVQALLAEDMDIARLDPEQARAYAETRYGTVAQRDWMDTRLIPPPAEILGSNVPRHGPGINRMEFEMSVLSPVRNERIHTYSSDQSEIGASSWPLEAVSNWRTLFPQLNDYYESGHLDSDIILVDCNINLLTDLPPKGSLLSIGFYVTVAGPVHQSQWSTKAEYYQNNGEPVDMMAFYEKSRIPKKTPWDDLDEIGEDAGGSSVKLKIKMQSTWWVQLLTNMAHRKLEMKYDPSLMEREEDWSRRYLEEMSVMQELWVTPSTEGALSKRVAVFLWRFSQAPSGQTGTTTWRRLKAPPKRSQINSPIQSPGPPLQRSMVLDATLQNLAMPQPRSGLTDKFLHQQCHLLDHDHTPFIADEDGSTEGSPSPALSPDYTTSFPSSTTTSFPPSITHGYLSHEESQESACSLRDSQLYAHDSFASQSSFVYSQQSAYVFDETVTSAEDMNHLSQMTGIGSQDPVYYSQQSLDAIAHYPSPVYESYADGAAHNCSNETNDFEAGHIELSFQQGDESSNSYSQPYMAPLLDLPHPVQLPPMSNLRSDGHQADATADASDDGTLDAIDSHLLPAQGDFDFSTLESHFTQEELAAIRSQGIEEYHLHTTTIQQSHTVIAAEKHGEDTASRPDDADQGAVLGEILDDDEVEEQVVAGLDEGFEFEDVFEDSHSAGDGQGHGQGHRYLGGGIGDDFEDIGDLHEDHL